MANLHDNNPWCDSDMTLTHYLFIRTCLIWRIRLLASIDVLFQSINRMTTVPSVSYQGRDIEICSPDYLLMFIYLLLQSPTSLGSIGCLTCCTQDPIYDSRQLKVRDLVLWSGQLLSDSGGSFDAYSYLERSQDGSY